MDTLPRPPLAPATPRTDVRPSFEPYERPSLTIPYVVGRKPIRRGSMVGLDGEGLLVSIGLARCFVGIANDAHPGSPEPRHNAVVNVTCSGSFVYGWQGPGAPDRRLLQRPAWALDGTTVCGEPGGLPVGRIVGIERASDGRPGVRVRIDQATGRCLPPLGAPLP